MKYVITLFSFLFATMAWTQDKGILKGVITELATKETLFGATIRNVADLSQGTRSDVNGNYEIELSAGSYQFVCGFPILASDTIHVVIVAGETVIRNIALDEISKLMETVVISSSRYAQKLEEQVVSLEVLKPSAITNKNATSIEGALESVPGVAIIDGDPQIRGGSGFTFGVGSRVAIVVDGIPLLSGDAGKPEWAYIPVENIEQVEIIKGASSVLYGSSAMNGVIHIRSAYPRSKPKTVINYSAGMYSKPSRGEDWYGNSIPGYTNLNFMHSRIIKKRLDFVIGGNLNIDQGYIGPAPDQPYMPQDMKEAFLMTDSIPTYSNQDMVKIRARMNFNLRYRSEKVKGLLYGINGNMMYNKTNLPFAWLDDSLGLYRSYPGALFMETQKLFNIDPFVKYISKSGVIHNLNTRVFHSNNYISNNQSNSGTLFYGEYQYNKKFKTIDLNFAGGIVGSLSTSQAELYASSGQARNENKNAAAYIQLDKKVWEILQLTGGVRYEFYKTNNLQSETAPIVRAGANLQLTKGTFVRTSFGQGYRYPTITERYMMTKAGLFGSYANPDLKPEKSKSFELGLKQGYKVGRLMGYIDIAGFYQHYENTIEYLFGVWDPTFTVVGFKFMNTGTSRVRGIDISVVGKTDEKKKFSMLGMFGYTFVDPVSLEPDLIYGQTGSLQPGTPGENLSYNSTSYNPEGNILKYRFKHLVKADLEFTYTKFVLGFSYRYYSKMENVDRSLGDIELITESAYPYFEKIKILNYWKSNNGYHLVDTRFSYKLSDKHRVSVICNNLFNVNYSLRPMKVESPRTISMQYIYVLGRR
ncbi:MAG: TonB-dependent receptor [Crocinitomicaceae bacterium]|nr:TonB-dependent receptor [Crocinitomicaceae bacterium]